MNFEFTAFMLCTNVLHHYTATPYCHTRLYCIHRYGSYDKSITVTRNVNLPDSLLSRFDMLFVVLDCMNEARDRQMAVHVITQV